ncbi:MAG TPA: hypothetical protein DGT23_14665, partial [Micromonosporaceae bacterium]|nr:hypothetical protein [Micromonosporaceae bacterium]
MVAGLAVAWLMATVQACDGGGPESTTGPSTSALVPEGVFAYQEPGRFTVMRDGNKISSVKLASEATYSSDSDWSSDGSRVAIVDGVSLISISTVDGAVTTTQCRCTDVAVLDDEILTVSNHAALGLDAYDPVTLSKRQSIWRPNIPAESKIDRVDGAGDLAVVFAINSKGASISLSDIYVASRTDGAQVRHVGDTTRLGTVVDSAYTPNGPNGTPVFAYATWFHASSCVGSAAVAWFDPTSAVQQTVTDASHLLSASGSRPSAGDFSVSWDNLWWSPDGRLRATGATWTCPQPPQPGSSREMVVGHSQWILDENTWKQSDRDRLASRRHLTRNVILEFGVGPDG